MKQLRRYLKLYREARKRQQHYSAEQIKNYQIHQLAAILEHARKNVPLQQARINSSDPASISRIPPIDKAAMQLPISDSVDHSSLKKLGAAPQDLDQFCLDFYKQESVWFKDHVMLAESTGTSGSKGLWFRNRDELLKRDAMRLARDGKNPLLLHIRKWPLRRAIVIMRNARYGTWQSANDASNRYGKLASIRTFSSLQDLDKLVYDLNAYDPHHLGTTPMYLEFLSRFKLEGKLTINPLLISSSGSNLSAAVRTLIQSAFPEAEISDVYASTECSPLAKSCAVGNLHLFEDAVKLETVDENDEPVPRDTFSHHILVTNLLRTFQPIIRYRLMDEVKISSRPCSCGSVFPVLEVRGRSNPEFPITLDDGSRGHLLSIDLDRIFSHLSMIRQFQVTCCTLDRFDVSIFVYGSPDDVKDFEIRHGKEIKSTFDQLAVKGGFSRHVQFVIQYEQLDLSKTKRMAFRLDLDSESLGRLKVP